MKPPRSKLRGITRKGIVCETPRFLTLFPLQGNLGASSEESPDSSPLLSVSIAMDTSRDTAFQLRLGAPEDMLVTFNGLKRPVGAALHAIFSARHAASTKYWADVVN